MVFILECGASAAWAWLPHESGGGVAESGALADSVSGRVGVVARVIVPFPDDKRGPAPHNSALFYQHRK